ncbi:MAG: response regulator [Opitutae bacterium]|nr:response regulator [Opitutae bacterium]
MIRVLYAEDDPNIAAVVRSYFEHFGRECALEVVETGRACLERMSEGGVDVLLLDLVLPDIDGLNILGELAMRRDRTPVVMLSGHGQNELAVRALRAGAVDCIDKSTAQFLQVVDLVQRVHAQHATTPAAAAPRPERHGPFHVLLIEGSADVAGQVRDFILRAAPQVALDVAATAADFNRFLREGAAADAVIVGPNPWSAKPLDLLRQLHSEAPCVPAILLSARSDGETAVAAFKLGAQDYILQKQDYLPELVFSLNNVLRRGDIERQNARLTRELEQLNRSLEAQVIARTAELQALSSRLLKIQEDERRAIARELHDEVGQLLTGLKFQLEAAAATAGPETQEKLTESLATATALMSHVRALTQLYRPRVLDDLGLQPALEWHAAQFQRQTGIGVSLDLALPAARLPGELETAIFRMTQEALTNVARHSGGKTANVTVTHDASHLIVEISDRGCGFDLAPVLARRDAVGLAGLRERVSLAGGRLEIFSQPGQGTRLHAEFPLPAAA